MKIQRRTFLFASLALAMAPGIGTASASDSAPLTVSEFYTSLLQVMKAGKQTPFPQRYQQLAPAVSVAFDLHDILRVSVGPEWSSIPATQQQQLLTAFQAFTVATYVSNFDSYDGRTVSVSPTTRSVSTSKIVSSTITDPGSGPSRIDYVLQPEAASWKVVDVLVDGTVSRVAVQRSDFSSLVTEGNATQLIATLRQKVSTLSGGTVVT